MSRNISLEHCYSCNTGLGPNEVGLSKFECPNCGTLIIRCSNCRRLANPYTCVNCKFEGP